MRLGKKNFSVFFLHLYANIAYYNRIVNIIKEKRALDKYLWIAVGSLKEATTSAENRQ